MDILEVKGLTKLIDKKPLLANISFNLPERQKLAVAGATGSGKTSLLKIIAGLTEATDGLVLFAGDKVKGPSEKLLPGHPEVAYLSQHFGLRNHYRVVEILEMASRVEGTAVSAICRLCRIDHLLTRWTHQLSGGEKQRIALARLLVTSPRVLLLDEPYSNLDPFHKNILKEVIDDLSRRLSVTCVLVSHDPLDILSWADKILILKNGELIQQGTPQQVFKQPVDEYAAGLFGKYFTLNEELKNSFAHFGETTLSYSTKFFRPADFKLVEAGNGVKGEVVELNFMGNFYEAKLNVGGNRLFVNVQDEGLCPGAIVYIAMR
jgi:ABC-type sulfate/molybdate transport systems ATPase subunit